RPDLDHGDVGRAATGDLQRVGGEPDRLVGRDRHVDASAYRDQLVHGGAGLLDVLEAACGAGQLADLRHGGVDVPGAVGIHPNPALVAQGLADRLDPED